MPKIWQPLSQWLNVSMTYFICDISKAFDKVRHLNLRYYLRQNSISGKLLNSLVDFLHERTQSVKLSKQYSSQAKFVPGVRSVSVLQFLIYIKDLSENLAPIPKLFADPIFLCSVKNINATDIDLKNDLKKIDEMAFQWKMSFSPDPAKKAHKLLFWQSAIN